MPWKVASTMDERVRFISRLLDGERMVDLCREFGVSRKTGYKFLNRYRECGFGGLTDLSRRRLMVNRTSDAVEKMVIRLREDRPTWGPKKIHAKLKELCPGVTIPAASTIGSILDRCGMISPRKRRRRATFSPSSKLAVSHAPNDIWCVDFKGQFRMTNGVYCYPLTISDHFSRYVLGCEALESTKSQSVFETFEAVFREYGMPNVIRSDNGSPFSSTGLAGLSRLNVWWIRLGITPERIAPGHPEQNGRHERFHLTLKQETTRPVAKNSVQQQEKFDQFVKDFNEYRPHEALGMAKPSNLYRPSLRVFPEDLPPLEYPLHDIVRSVHTAGGIRLGRANEYHISQALAGERVGLRELAPKLWLVSFAGIDLGMIDEEKGRLIPKEQDPTDELIKEENVTDVTG
jgi:transposase InsO family protein